MFWSAIPGAGDVVRLSGAALCHIGKTGYKGKIIVLTLIAIPMVVAIDFVVGYRGWSVNYALPSAILFSGCGNSRSDVHQPAQLAELHDVADFYDSLQRCPAGLVCGGGS